MANYEQLISGSEADKDRKLKGLVRIAKGFAEMNIGKELTEAALQVWEDGYRAGHAEGFAAANRKETNDAEG